MIADRSDERLGRSDSLVLLFRNLWARDLRALAEGTPLTNWHRLPPELYELSQVLSEGEEPDPALLAPGLVGAMR